MLDTVRSRPQKKPVDYVAYLSRQVIAQNRTGNLYFLVDSMKFIAQTIRKAGLAPEQVRGVCANTGESTVKNACKPGKTIRSPGRPIPS